MVAALPMMHNSRIQFHRTTDRYQTDVKANKSFKLDHSIYENCMCTVINQLTEIVFISINQSNVGNGQLIVAGTSGFQCSAT